MQDNATPLLEAEDVTRRFGGLVALDGYRLVARRGDLIGLIGPNGAGKTTAFNLLTGVLKPSGGRIRLEGQDLSGCKPEAFAAAGITRTFQNVRLFRDLSAWENVAVGLHMREGPGWLAALFGFAAQGSREARLRERAQALLARVGLADAADRLAGDLPYGDQRRLEIARALATGPKILLLDEPAAGLNPTETAALTRTLRDLHGEGDLAIVLVEHDMALVMALARHIQVLDRGRLIAEGPPEAVRADPEVIAAYLGTRRRGADRQAAHA